MALIPLVPNIIPVPFGHGAQRTTIPTLSPSASSPQASWTSGFPPITMANKQAGGKPPLGQDFNSILYELSSHAYFSQSGCVYPWVGADSASGFPGLNYLKGSHVLGSNGEEYIALQPSGPDVPGTDGSVVGPIDPVGETAAEYWKKMGGKESGGVPAGSVMPFYNVRLGGAANRNPIFWGETEPDTGWLICDGGSDGLMGTVPDLHTKFIMGAGNMDDVGQTGGALSVTPTITINWAASNISVNGTTLDTNTLAYHSHTVETWRLQGSDGHISSYATNTRGGDYPTLFTGASYAHTHSVTDPTHTHGATASSIATIPPFYKLIYCVKLP